MRVNQTILFLSLIAAVFLSCDPAQPVKIVNDTKSVFLFSYIDPNTGSDKTIELNTNETYDLWMLPSFPSESAKSVNDFIETLKILTIRQDDTIVIAEKENAAALLKKVLVRENDIWVIHCGDFSKYIHTD